MWYSARTPQLHAHHPYWLHCLFSLLKWKLLITYRAIHIYFTFESPFFLICLNSASQISIWLINILIWGSLLFLLISLSLKMFIFKLEHIQVTCLPCYVAKRFWSNFDVYRYELLFYPRYHLDQSSLLYQKPLLAQPMVMDVYQDYLLVTYRPFVVHIFHVKIFGELTPLSTAHLQVYF